MLKSGTKLVWQYVLIKLAKKEVYLRQENNDDVLLRLFSDSILGSIFPPR